MLDWLGLILSDLIECEISWVYIACGYIGFVFLVGMCKGSLMQWQRAGSHVANVFYLSCFMPMVLFSFALTHGIGNISTIWLRYIRQGTLEWAGS